MANFLSELFGGGSTAEAANLNRGLLMDNYLRGSDAINRGYDRSTGFLNSGYDAARTAYDPLRDLASKYGGATSLGLDALGVNGAGGNQRAVDAFQTSPGYDFQRDQGLQAIDRRRAVGGMYRSGNADLDTLKFSQGLANQEYGNWLQRLLGFTSPELAATSGAATGTAAAETGRGAGLAGLSNNYADNQVNLLNSLNSGNMQANNATAAARQTGAGNLLGAGLSLASLAARAAGGGGFGGFGGFGGGAPTAMSMGGSPYLMYGK